MSKLVCGPLSDANVQAGLAQAQQEPGAWQVYLVRGTAGPRTPAQNRLYRRLLSKFAQQMGYSVDYWHEFLVGRYLGYEDTVTEDGYARKVLASTSDLSVAEFNSFLDACLRFASEHQVEI